MEILIAYACISAISGGILYGVLEWLIKDIIFERIGKKRRERLEQPKPELMLARKEQR